MITVNEMRDLMPEYKSLPEGEFVRAVHKKLYSDVPYQDFLKQVDFSQKVDPTADMSTTDKLRAGAGKFMYDVGRGVSQRLGGMTPQQVDQANALDAPLMNTGAGMAGYAGGALATSLPLAMLPGANTALGSIGYGALSGAAMPTGANESPEMNTLMGGGAGLLGVGLGKVLSGAAPLANRNNPATQNLVDLATTKYGIDLPASTRTGNKTLSYLESQSAQLPGGGSMQQAIRKPQEQLAEQVMRQAGGQGTATQATLDAAKASTQKGYQNIWSGATVGVDAQLGVDLDKAWKSAQRMLSDKDAQIVRNQIDNIWDKAQAVKGSKTALEIPGDVYQMGLRPELRNSMPADGPLKHALSQVQKALDGAANRSLGKSGSTVVKDLNREYAIQKAIGPLIPAAEARGGTFTPSGLLGPLGQFSGDVGELAKIGPLLREPPNSGTVTRGIMAGGLLGLPGMAAGGLPGAAAALAVPYAANVGASRLLSSPAVQKYLSQGFGSLTDAEKRLVQIAVQSGALSTPASVNAMQ